MFLRIPTKKSMKNYSDEIMVNGKDYFVITTNVDHCFQKAGFDKHRMFYTQGDYGLWQCRRPCHHETYDNRKIVEKMVEAQGYTVAADGTTRCTENDSSVRISTSLFKMRRSNDHEFTCGQYLCGR